MAKAERSALPGEAIRDCHGGMPKVVRSGHKRWSDRSESVFLGTLATTCNVMAAAEAAGFSTSSAYQRRLRDAGFAQRWRQALEIGYERIEALLIEAAEQNLSGAAIELKAPIPHMTVADAIRILEQYRRTVKNGIRRAGRHSRELTADEVRASIARKLDAIERARGQA
jgi:hypothetical protein